MLWWLKLKFISKYSWNPRSFWLWCSIPLCFWPQQPVTTVTTPFAYILLWLDSCPTQRSCSYFWVFPWAQNRSLGFLLLEPLILSLYSCPCSASCSIPCPSEPILVHSHLLFPHQCVDVVYSHHSCLPCYLCSFIPTGHVSIAAVGLNSSDSLLLPLWEVWLNRRLRMALSLPWGWPSFQPLSAHLHLQLLLM